MTARPQPVIDPRMLRVLGFEDLHVGMRESLMKAVMDSDVGAHGLDGVVDAAGRIYVLDLVAGDIQVMQRKAKV